MKRYEIRLPYALSENLAAAFPEMDALALGPNVTVLIGVFRDQSEFHAIIARIGDMGLEITEVRQVP